MIQTNGTREEHTLYSEHIKKEITFTIYYSSMYTPLIKHHLLIAQDGQDYFNLGKVHRVIEKLTKEGSIQPTIVVGIPYSSPEERFKLYHPSQAGQKNYIRFLAEELLPYLDDHLPLLGLAHSRTLIGDSLGGTVSLQAAFTYPNTFGQVIMQSPFVNDDVMEFLKRTKLNSILSIVQTVGKHEENVFTPSKQWVNFVEGGLQLKDSLANFPVELHYAEYEGDHTWTNWEKQLEDVLKISLAK
ncbi:alpha/beta hydrolase-fold protein [Gottfriedia acidiceleris]|uniref:alpha/beta hydrolase n=1 Tax=Gottfriedia acidiceleris TaxID=371036 RepID=UPI002F26B4B1